jgi:hypothetical protein
LKQIFNEAEIKDLQIMDPGDDPGPGVVEAFKSDRKYI